ncbi:MAG: metallophosphoesterase [Bacteroidales bacterium]|nr:metallophosphoesterase [Bacteroidales bacterium]
MKNLTSKLSPVIYSGCYSIILLCFAALTVRGQSDTAYSFLVAGHAYGAHSGGNLGLHPALLECLDRGFSSDAAFIVFTGDIVNLSSEESWTQVETELSAYPLESWYVMGNHDNTPEGIAVFNEKHGGTYYSFTSQSSMFVVLNSTVEQRSVPEEQILFLGDLLNTTGDSIHNVFVFFHEVLWNSHEKYVDTRSNSRSRYDQIISYSNYWEDLHPLFTSFPDINFYCIAGDVGGNPDAIAAFYDCWDNVTLIASGMGEVYDENYLTVHVANEDSVWFQLTALIDTVQLNELDYYSVPCGTGPVSGPDQVTQWDTGVAYSVPRIFNADTYNWILPEGVYGESLTNSIRLSFTGNFTTGTLLVSASHDGYGSGPAGSLDITAAISDLHLPPSEGKIMIKYSPGKQGVDISPDDSFRGNLEASVYSMQGKLLSVKSFPACPGRGEYSLAVDHLPSGVYLVRVQAGSKLEQKKILVP